MRVFWWVTGTYVFATFVPFQDALPLATRGFSTVTSGITGPNVSGGYINSVAPTPYNYGRSPYQYRNYAGRGRDAYYIRDDYYTGQYDYQNCGDACDFDFRPVDCDPGWRGPVGPC
jgi:hypothetical protein